MQLWESTRIALIALRTNKLRTTLTMLGIIIGVTAVISLLSIGTGFQQNVQEQFGNLGVNLLSVQSGRFRGGGGGDGPRLSKPPQPITIADAVALDDPLRLPEVVAISPEYSLVKTVVYGQQELSSRVIGVRSSYRQVHDAQLTSGQFITLDHVNRKMRVAVLGSEVVNELFPNSYPIGKTVRLEGIPFEVIGTLEEVGGFMGPDSSILIPLSTAHTRLEQGGTHRGSPIVSEIYLKVADSALVAQAKERITQVMRQRHNLLPEDVDDFSIRDQGEFLQQVNTFTLGMTIFLGVIAGISLLVGGIGVMNIMLVSVTERTREIGIRKAVGAKQRDILLQFLVEAVVLTLLGGFVGIGLGYGISKGLPMLLGDSFGTPVVTPGSILLATSFCIMIGLFFGVYPATRAARLKPIDALRYE